MSEPSSVIFICYCKKSFKHYQGSPNWDEANFSSVDCPTDKYNSSESKTKYFYYWTYNSKCC